MTQSIVISLRLNPYHLARAYDGLRKLHEIEELDSNATVVKSVFMYGLGTISSSLETSEESKEWVRRNTRQIKTRTKINFDNILAKPKAASKPASEVMMPINNPYLKDQKENYNEE